MQANIRIMVGDAIFESNRISFMQMHFDVEVC